MSRQKDDFYPTPDTAIRPLLDIEMFDGKVWECACGNGAISNVLQDYGYETVDTDLNDWGYGESRRDFLMEREALAPNIVTNPPYKLAQQFIQQAIDLGVHKHCWLLRLAFLEGVKRFNELFVKNQPSRIYVFSKRVTMWRGDEEPTGTGTTCYAWFVWEGKSYSTEVDWI
jgi:hypothetical protein